MAADNFARILGLKANADIDDIKKREIQIDSLPTADSSNVGKIYQYVGETTSSYKNGVFYQSVYDSTSEVYSWIEKEVNTFDEITIAEINAMWANVGY